VSAGKPGTCAICDVNAAHHLQLLLLLLLLPLVLRCSKHYCIGQQVLRK
jgi:hypothetical protein